jgi:hypothetical protein
MTLTSPHLPKETLTDLDLELDTLLSHLTSEEEGERTIAEELFERDLLPRLEKKIDGYVARIQRLKAQRDFRLSEAKRLEALAQSDDAQIQWLTEKLLTFMQNRVDSLGDKGKRLEGKLCQVCLCRNGGKEPIWINSQLGVLDFPDDYIVEIPTLNTEKLKEEVLSKGEIFDRQGRLLAKVMPRGHHVRIS